MNLKKLIWNSTYLNDHQRIEWYPPFCLMRIKVLELDNNWRTIRIYLPHTWLSTNSGGSLFGGFQACLADPIAAMACVKLFPDYAVWIRALTLDFQREGTDGVELKFAISLEQEQKITAELKAKGRSTPCFEYGYYQKDGSLCTLVKATVAIRSRNYQKQGIKLLK